MDKGLHLQLPGAFGNELSYLVQGQLPGQDDPTGPLVIPKPGGGVVGDPRLGRHVPLYLWGIPLRQGKYAGIADNEGVRAVVLQTLKIFRQAVQLPVARVGVHRHMDRHAVAVGIVDGLGQSLLVKIPRKGPHAVLATRQIDRVRAVAHRRLQPLHVPRRGQQLDPHAHSPLFSVCPPAYSLGRLFKNAWCSL